MTPGRIAASRLNFGVGMLTAMVGLVVMRAGGVSWPWVFCCLVAPAAMLVIPAWRELRRIAGEPVARPRSAPGSAMAPAPRSMSFGGVSVVPAGTLRPFDMLAWGFYINRITINAAQYGKRELTLSGGRARAVARDPGVVAVEWDGMPDVMLYADELVEIVAGARLLDADEAEAEAARMRGQDPGRAAG